MPSTLGSTKHILAPGCHPPVRNTHRALVQWCYLHGVCTELWGHLRALWLTLARKHPLGGRIYITDKRDPVPARRSILLCLSYRGRVSFPLLIKNNVYSSGRCYIYHNQKVETEKSTHLNCRHEKSPMEPVIQGSGRCPVLPQLPFNTSDILDPGMLLSNSWLLDCLPAENRRAGR